MRSVILMPGYGVSASSSEGVKPDVVLSKPIRMTKLQSAIEDIIPQVALMKDA
jgi:hypothetical protein